MLKKHTIINKFTIICLLLFLHNILLGQNKNQCTVLPKALINLINSERIVESCASYYPSCSVDTNFSYIYLKSHNINNFVFLRIRFLNAKYIKEEILRELDISDNRILSNALTDSNYFCILVENNYHTCKIDSLCEDSIIKLRLIHNSIEYNCDYIIAYDTLQSIFFKLKGFRNNDYREFINFLFRNSEQYLSVIMCKKIHKIKNLQFHKYSRIISNNIVVDEINFRELNRWAIDKKYSSPPYSCYQKELVVVH